MTVLSGGLLDDHASRVFVFSLTFTLLRRRKQRERSGFESRHNTSWVTGRPSAWHSYTCCSMVPWYRSLQPAGRDALCVHSDSQFVFLLKCSEPLKVLFLVYFTSLYQANGLYSVESENYCERWIWMWMEAVVACFKTFQHSSWDSELEASSTNFSTVTFGSNRLFLVYIGRVSKYMSGVASNCRVIW